MASIRHKVNKKNGKKTYYVVTYVNGKHKWVKADSYEDAKRLKAETESQIYNGSYVDPGKSTFEDLEKKYWKSRKKLAASTKRGYETKLENQIRPYFKGMKLADISKDTCQSFQDYLCRKRVKPKKPTSPPRHLSNQTINSAITLASTIFNFAVEENMMSKNPFRGIGKLDVSKKEVNVMEFHDMERLASCCSGTCREFLITVLYTGMRASEARGLHWEDIDFKNRFINIKRSYDIKNGPQKTKTKSSERNIPILQPLYDVLLEYYERKPRRPGDYVFVAKNGEPLLWYHDSLKRALKKAELPEMSLHDLRHSFLSALDSMGIRLTLIKEIAGHSTIATTANIYNHQTKRDLTELRNEVDGLLSPNGGNDSGE